MSAKADEPETFAEAIAKLRTYGAWQDNDRIDAVVAAHEREVARLRAQLNCDDNFKIARDLDNARDALAAAESDIAELKAQKECAGKCCREQSENIVKLFAEIDAANATIAELKEALRKIADKPFNAGCIAQSGDHCDAKSCQDCTYSMRNFARAALEKTEKGE